MGARANYVCHGNEIHGYRGKHCLVPGPHYLKKKDPFNVNIILQTPLFI